MTLAVTGGPCRSRLSAISGLTSAPAAPSSRSTFNSISSPFLFFALALIVLKATLPFDLPPAVSTSVSASTLARTVTSGFEVGFGAVERVVV